jgi:UDPglucose 6-dehydrogenase
MKICVVGTGYVGLVTGTCLAEMGNDVVCVDKDATKIEALQRCESPIYEPGLQELIEFNTAEQRLRFSTDLPAAVQASELCFIAVGTPQDENGRADLSAVFTVGRAIARALNGALNGHKVIVVKSTVPVGTCEALRQVMQEETSLTAGEPFTVVSNPEFLKQGDAVNDFMKPDRIIVGCDTDAAAEPMKELYAPFMRTGNRLLLMDVQSAEMTKYVANAFLATKISFMNEMSHLCERLGANIESVRYGLSTDKRIGHQFLFPGLGYGGSCFPKDVRALLHAGQDVQFHSRLLDAVDTINVKQRYHFLQKVLAYFNHTLQGKTLAVWGLAFKPNTDDIREAPSVTVLDGLLAEGARLQVFDPKAMPQAKRLFGDKLVYASNKYDCLEQADALLLLTEWNEFRRPNFEAMVQQLRHPVIFDGRNQYDPETMAKRGFTYISIGRKPLQELQELEPMLPFKPELVQPV